MEFWPITAVHYTHILNLEFGLFVEGLAVSDQALGERMAKDNCPIAVLAKKLDLSCKL